LIKVTGSWAPFIVERFHVPSAFAAGPVESLPPQAISAIDAQASSSLLIVSSV
jgi:hypothetical protein